MLKINSTFIINDGLVNSKIHIKFKCLQIGENGKLEIGSQSLINQSKITLE